MNETVLGSQPRLGPLYVRAVVGMLGSRRNALPETVVVREDVTADAGQLAGYARLCGFPLDGALPVSYPHVLGFGLQVKLMADRTFPLAVPGLVHVRNRITAHQPIEAGESMRIAVHAERFVAHPKGAQVDLVTEVNAGDEPVWEGRSTYLARGASAPNAADPAPPEPDGAAAPESAGAPPPAPTGVDDAASSAVWQVAGDIGRRYARVSGDVNPIHLHPLTARAFGFPRPIAHGMWTAARALAALQGRLPEAYTYDVVFGKPLLLPSTVELRVRERATGWNLDVRAASSGAYHLRASIR